MSLNGLQVSKGKCSTSHNKIIALLSDIIISPIALSTILLSSCVKDIESKKGTKTPVLFLHGSGGNHLTMAVGALCLSKAGHPVYTIQYDKLFFGTRELSIRDFAQRIREKVREIVGRHRPKGDVIQNSSEGDIILVGHSMGGLVAAVYDLYHSRDDEVNVTHVFTIGTPWHGSSMIEYLAKITKLTTRHSEMRVGSELLQTLRCRADDKYITIGSKGDLHVPFPSSILNDRRHFTLNYASHWNLVLSSDVWNYVISVINST